MVYNWVKLSGEGEANASDKAARFLTMIPNPERRIYYAEKFGNYDVAMDVSYLRKNTFFHCLLFERLLPMYSGIEDN
jgi:hypothetical protein